MANIIQVLGLGRTGTTMIHLMLANARDAFACGEIYAFYRPWRSHHFKPKCSCNKKYIQCVWRSFDHVEENCFHSKLASKLGVQWIVDESKRLRWVIDCQKWAEDNNMKIFNILMWKEPVDLMYSHWKRSRSINKIRREIVSYYGRFLKLQIPFILVNLTEFLRKPDKQLLALCNAIGMEYFPGKERFWEKQHCHLFGSLGVRKQMGKGEVRFQSKSALPEEFMKMARPQLAKIEKDQEFNKIQSQLMQLKLDRIAHYNGIPQPVSKRILPLWYYIDILISKYQKNFPQQWKFAQ